MRISTVTMFERSLHSMLRQQSDFLAVGQQIASGKRVLNPSDDPQAASRAVAVAQAAAVNQQYEDARVSARNSLGQEESTLNSISDAISSAKTLLVQATSDTLSNADRQAVASELNGIYEAMLGHANKADGNGRYLFGGYQDSSPPFVKQPDGSILYVGDTGLQLQQVDASRQMPNSDHGASIFQRVGSMAGFVSVANPANTGSVTLTSPHIIDTNNPAFGTGFDIDFVDDAGVMSYTINGGAPTPYQSGDFVMANGLSIKLEGAPQPGDKIQIVAAKDGNTDLFTTIKRAIDALNTNVVDQAGRAAQRNALLTSSMELDNSLDNVLTVRASVGARLNELDVLDVVGSNRELNYKQTLSALVDLDYNEAVSEYSLRQIGLQAAQKAFLDVQRLSLFDQM